MENEPKKTVSKFDLKNVTADRLRERAADVESTNHHFGPKAGKALRAVLLTLADLGEPEPQLVHKPEPAVKRQRV